MFNKKATASQGASSKDSSVGKSKAAPATHQPVAQPDKAPAKVAPARKS
jgi:hypothetical protein